MPNSEMFPSRLPVTNVVDIRTQDLRAYNSGQVSALLILPCSPYSPQRRPLLWAANNREARHHVCRVILVSISRIRQSGLDMAA